jgi:hypothetical protein
VHHDWRIIGELDDVEQLYAMVSNVGAEGFRREKPINLKFVGTLFGEESL